MNTVGNYFYSATIYNLTTGNITNTLDGIYTNIDKNKTIYEFLDFVKSDLATRAGVDVSRLHMNSFNKVTCHCLT